MSVCVCVGGGGVLTTLEDFVTREATHPEIILMSFTTVICVGKNGNYSDF